MCKTCKQTTITYSCVKTSVCNRISLELPGLTRVYEWFNGVCELDINGVNTGYLIYNSIGELAKYEQHHLDNYNIANQFLPNNYDKSVISKTKYKRDWDVATNITIVQLADLLNISTEAAKILLDNRRVQDLTKCPVNYTNTLITENIQRNNCPPNYTGTTVTYTINAGQFFSSISQADAQAKAQTYFNQTKQSYANTNGNCIENIKYSNTAQCTQWSKNNCPFNHTTQPVTVCVPAGTFTSYISQIDVDTMAQNRLNQTKQDLANQLGVCTQIIYTNTQQSFTANCIAPATGSYTHTIAAGSISSNISQLDANNKALLQAEIMAKQNLVCVNPPMNAAICVTFTNLQTITPGAIGVYNLQTTIVNGKQIYTKSVQNELDNGVIENWTMQWQWSNSLNVWQLFRIVNGNANPVTALAQTTTSNIIGATTNNGNIVVENFTPGQLCSCQSSCYSGTLRTNLNNVVSNTGKGFTRDYSYLYKGIETHIQSAVTVGGPNAGNSYHRWRKENNNLWKLMNYISGTPVEIDRKSSNLLIDNVVTVKGFSQSLNSIQIDTNGFCNIECI